MLVSVQGTRGGYRLGRRGDGHHRGGRDSGRRRPGDGDRVLADDHACDQFTKCSIRDPLWKIKNRILEALTTVTVAEMAADAETRRRGADGVADDVRARDWRMTRTRGPEDLRA